MQHDDSRQVFSKDPSLKIIIDASPVGIMVFDHEAHVVYANPVAEKLFNNSADVSGLQKCGDFIACYQRHADPEGCGHTENCPNCPFFRAIRSAVEQGPNMAYLEGEASLIREPRQPALWIKFKVNSIIIDGRKTAIMAFDDITEQKLSQERLTHSHHLMRYIIEHTRSAIAVHDRDLRYIHVSKRYLDEYNVKEKDILGKHHYEVFPDLPQKWRDVHQRALSGEICSSEEDPYCRDDGTVDWTRWECRPWYDVDGLIGGIIVYTEVITERKLAEETLRESAHQLREAQQIARLGRWELNLLTGHLEWSESIFDLFEVDSRSFSASYEAFLKFVHPDDRDLVDFSFQDSVKSRKPYEIEHRLQMPDGRVKWVNEIGRTEYDAFGKPLRSIGTVQDITERKQSENSLRQFKTVFDTANFGTAITDLNGKLTYVNKYFAEAHGYKSTELEGKHVEVFHNKTQMPKVEELIKQLRNNGGFNAQEVDHCHRNGKVFPMLMTGKLIRDASGEPQYMSATAIDISDRKALETQLAQAQKMESVGRLAGGVAHDFNNMLGIILGHTDMALDYLDPGQPVYSDLTEIRKATMRSADLVRQLLAFARKQTIAPKVLDLNDTVEGMLKMLRRLIGEDIDLSWMPGKNLWPVNMDPTQIDQILANLCVNARDAIDGVGKVTIETENVTLDEDYYSHHSGSVPGDYVLLAVSDDGCGMEKEILDKIYDPFFTTKEVGKGTGLGLPMIYGIVKQNEGYINVYSEPGEGTTFRIYIPRHIGKVEKEHKRDAEQSIAGGSETVLLVEDEHTLLQMGKAMLERLGYRVLDAGSPTAAMKIAEENKNDIHLLITDVIMPGMTGRELADRLSSLYPDMKLIFMSGYTADAIAHHGVLDPGVKFVQKPFSMKDLANRIREAFEN